MLAFGSKAFIGFSIEQQRLDVRIGSVAAIGNSVRPMTGFGRNRLFVSLKFGLGERLLCDY